MYAERQTWANSVDSDQTPQNAERGVWSMSTLFATHLAILHACIGVEEQLDWLQPPVTNFFLIIMWL